MPSRDAAIECQYLGFQCHQLGAKRGNARARHFREPGVLDIGNDLQQLLDALVSNRRYDPELCEAGADRVDNRPLLPDEQRLDVKLSSYINGIADSHRRIATAELLRCPKAN
jgi:hypothetical protein